MLQWLHTVGRCPDIHAAVVAATAGHVAVLGWLLSMKNNLIRKQQQAEAADVALRCSSELVGPLVHVPTLMLWGDHMPHTKLSGDLQKQLKLARTTYCALHGLMYWRRRQLSHSSSCSKASSSKASKPMTDAMRNSPAVRHQLLTHLAKLPDDLVIRIAVAAGLQHDQRVSTTCLAQVLWPHRMLLLMTVLEWAASSMIWRSQACVLLVKLLPLLVTSWTLRGMNAFSKDICPLKSQTTSLHAFALSGRSCLLSWQLDPPNPLPEAHYTTRLFRPAFIPDSKPRANMP